MMDFEYDDRDLEGYFEDMEQEQSPGEYIGMAQVELMNVGMYHQLLNVAIGLASKDWTWRFRSQEYKLKKITGIFRHLRKLIDEARDE